MAIERIDGSSLPVTPTEQDNVIYLPQNQNDSSVANETISNTKNLLGTAGQFQNLSGGGGDDSRMAYLQQSLGLSDDQMSQLNQINSTIAPGPERLQAFQSILTTDQKDKMQSGVGHHHGHGGHIPDLSDVDDDDY